MTQDRLEEIILRTAESIAGTQLTGPRRVTVLQSLAALLLGPESGEGLSERDTGSLDEHIQARLRAAQEHALEACGVEPSAVEVRFVREHVADEAIEDTLDPTAQATGMATVVQTAGTLPQPIHRVVFTNDAGLAGLSALYGKEPDAFGTVALDSGMRAGLSSRPGLTVVSIAQDLAAVEGAIVESLPVGRQRERLRQESRGRDLVGTILDNRYRIDHFIGRGGFGVVYRASLVHAPDIRVAIKVIDPRYAASTSVRESLKEEFGTLATLTHPSVVEWKGFGETNEGGIYFAMTYLDGEELSKVLKQETKLPPARAYPILLRILDALRYVHGKNVFHLDLKPANIFLVRDGARGQQQVKLIDFGISLRSSSGASTGTVPIEEAGNAKEPRQGTQGGARKSVQVGSLGSSMSATQRVAGGTPLYASPEQCKHLRRDLDFQALTGASDLYSFGVVAYQLLTGRYPYAEFPELERRMRSSSPDEVAAARLDAYRVHLEVPPVPLKRLAPKLDRRLGRLIERTLAKSPEDRFKSTEDCYQQFRAVLEPKPVWPTVVAGLLLVAVIALTLRAVYGPNAGSSEVALVRAAGSETVSHVSREDGPNFTWPAGVTPDELPQLLDEEGVTVEDLVAVSVSEGFGLRRSGVGGDTEVEGCKFYCYWPDFDIKSSLQTLGLDPVLRREGLVRSVKARVSNEPWNSGENPELKAMLVPESGAKLDLEFEVDPTQRALLHPDFPATCTYSYGDEAPNVANVKWTPDGEKLEVDFPLPSSAKSFEFALTPRPRASTKGKVDSPLDHWSKSLPVVHDLVAFRDGALALSLVSIANAGVGPGTAPTNGQAPQVSSSESGPRYQFIRRGDDQRPPNELQLLIEATVVPNGLGYVASLHCGDVELMKERVDGTRATLLYQVPLADLPSMSEPGASDGKREGLITFKLNQAEDVLGAPTTDDDSLEFTVAWDPEPVRPMARIDIGERQRASFAFDVGSDPLQYVAGDDLTLDIQLDGKGPMRFVARLHRGSENLGRKEAEVGSSGKYPLSIVLDCPTQVQRDSQPDSSVELEVCAWSAHEGALDDAEPHFRFALPVERLDPMGVRVRPLWSQGGDNGPAGPASATPDGFADVASWGTAIAREHVVWVGDDGGLEVLVTSGLGEAKLTIDKVKIAPSATIDASGTMFRWNVPSACKHAEPLTLEAVLVDGSGRPKEFDIAFTPSIRPPQFEVARPSKGEPWPGVTDGHLLPVRVEVEGEEPVAMQLIDFVQVRILELEARFAKLERVESGAFTGNISVPYSLGGRKVTLEVEVWDRAGRRSEKSISDVTVPKLQFDYPGELDVLLADGVAADMLFVDADAVTRGSYRLLEFAPAVTWEKVLAELEARASGEIEAYLERNQNEFEVRLSEERQFGTTMRNAYPPASLDLSYYLDRSEVSVEQYRAFVEAPEFLDVKWWPHLRDVDRTPDKLEVRRTSLRGVLVKSIASDGDVRLPVRGVDWHAANAFARWSGRRLQSWFEWEFATRDGLQGRCFADPSEASFESIRAPDPGAVGFVHLTGNVAEWTCTPQLKRTSSPDLIFTTFGPPTDAKLQEAGGKNSDRFFVVVGGAVADAGSVVYFDYTAMTTSRETPPQPNRTLGPFGFRCAMSVDGEIEDLLSKLTPAEDSATRVVVPARDLRARSDRSN